MPVKEVHLVGLSAENRQVLEAWLDEFDQSWDEGRFEAWLKKLPALDNRLQLPGLVEIVWIDMERRWDRGNRVSLEWYLKQFPQLGTPDDVPAELILAEYEVRQRFGVAADLEAYAMRFPRQAEAMRRLVEQGNDAGRTSTPQPGADPTTGGFPKGRLRGGLMPEQFGHYRIIRKLGACGMGTVYLAHDTKLDREIALKVPHFVPDDDPAVLQRFDREARAAAALAHPNICSVHEVGEIDGTSYLTMTYVNGKVLSEFIKADKPIPQRRAAALVRTLARALQYAHVEGVIHRDLKPSNIMMKGAQDSDSWEPTIIDFGLAQRIGKADPRLTPSGAVLGTPSYMAPEQVAGRTHTVEASCDIYSLGTILYHLLTCRLPFEGSLTEVMSKILTEEPARPSLYRPELDARLETVCLKAMAKKPEDRYASMAELAEALNGYLQEPEGGKLPAANGVAAPSTQPKSPADIGNRGGRSDKPRWNRMYTWIATALAGGLLLIVGTHIWKWSQPTESANADKPLPQLALYWHGFVQPNRSDEVLALWDSMTLFSKDQYRLVFVPSDECYLYVIGVDRNGPTLWFPHEQIGLSNQCRAKTEYQIPDGENWFTLDDQTGTETIYLLASHERLRELEDLVKTKQDNPQEAAATLDLFTKALEKRSAEELQTRGQTIQPDQRIAKAKLKNGKEAKVVMEVNLGAGYVVKRIRFEHRAPQS